MELMEIIRSRRSIRRFSDKEIRKEDLEAVLEAALYAPSAGGRQGVLFVVSQDREVNLRLGRIKRSASKPSMASGECYVSREQPSIADDPSITDAFYGAPVVVTLFAPKDFLFSKEDAAMAAENLLLAAEDLGIGGCYLGQGWLAFADPYGQETLKRWNVRPDYYAVSQVVLGYPREGDKHPQGKPRKPGRIIYAC